MIILEKKYEKNKYMKSHLQKWLNYVSQPFNSRADYGEKNGGLFRE